MKIIKKFFIAIMLMLMVFQGAYAKENEEIKSLDELLEIIPDLVCEEIYIKDIENLDFWKPTISDVNDYGVLVNGIILKGADKPMTETIMLTKNGDIIEDPVIFCDGLAVAYVVDGDEKRYGYINMNLDWVVPPIYTYAGKFEDGYARADRGKTHVIIDKTAQIVCSFYIDDLYIYNIVSDDRFMYNNKNTNEIGLLNKNFEKVYKFNTNEFMFTSNYLFRNDIYYVIDHEVFGKVITAYNTNGEKLHTLNLESEFGAKVYIEKYGMLLENGDLVFRTGGYGMNHRVVIFSGATGEIKLCSREHEKNYNIITFNEFSDKLIIDRRIYDNELNYFGEFSIPGYILGTGDSRNNIFACMKECEPKEGMVATGIQNPLYYIYDKDRIEKDVYAIARSEVPDYFKPSGEIITVNINNIQVEFDTEPITESDRTLVPMRAIFEMFNATISWDERTQTAIVTKDDVNIRFTIDENKMYKNGEEILIDVPTRLVNGSETMIPIRAISEAFGCEVLWDEETKIVEILTNYYSE